MIDRKGRDELAAALRLYMTGKITNFEFDTVREKIVYASSDKTIQLIGYDLWYCYDDCKEDFVIATKERWDYLNRLLLILESDGCLEEKSRYKKWDYPQAIAGIAFFSFILIVIKTGWGNHLFFYTVPLGVLSMLLAWHVSSKQQKSFSAKEIALTPFSSISSLLSIRRQVRNFTKLKYPGESANREIRSALSSHILLLPIRCTWLLFSPLILFFQMFPEKKYETQIIIPEETNNLKSSIHLPSTH